VIRFQIIAPSKPESRTCWFTIFDVNHAFADGAGDSGAEEKCRDEIPKGSPRDGAEGREDARGNNRGDGIGGVVPAVREFEREREGDDEKEEREAGHRGSGALENDAFDDVGDVSHLSTAVSMTSKISFHLMIWTGSVSSSKSWRSACGRGGRFRFRTVDLDAVLEGALRRFDGANGDSTSAVAETRTFTRSRVPATDGVHTIEHEAAGGGVNEVDDVVELVQSSWMSSRSNGVMRSGSAW